jgi:hypothetical protein
VRSRILLVCDDPGQSRPQRWGRWLGAELVVSAPRIRDLLPVFLSRRPLVLLSLVARDARPVAMAASLARVPVRVRVIDGRDRGRGDDERLLPSWARHHLLLVGSQDDARALSAATSVPLERMAILGQPDNGDEAVERASLETILREIVAVRTGRR